MNQAPKTIAILGGGISGLSTAYYLQKLLGNKIKPIILEGSSRTGGWIKTVGRTCGSDSHRFEIGPRTIRPAGVSGLNTLDLLEEIGLDKEVMYVTNDHPAAKNRFIYAKDKLIKLPSDMSVLFKKVEPFDKPLFLYGLRDLIKMRKRLEDDSIYNFVHRRFGKDIATYVIDPVIRGICAGDSRDISVKFLAKVPFEMEQRYGSVLGGFLIEKLLRRSSKKDTTEHEESIGLSKIALNSLIENWSVWSLESGLQSLPSKLEQILVTNGAEIRKDCVVTNLKMGDKNNPSLPTEVEYIEGGEKGPKTLSCSHIVSTIPATVLSKIMRYSKPSQPSLWRIFETFQSVDVRVTNLMYKDDALLDFNAFGFLVPSIEKSLPGLLGVVFDTCSFPQDNKTVLTCMSQTGHKTEDLSVIRHYLQTTLNITRAPDDVYSEVLNACIPQYNVGHYEKVDAVRKFVKASKLPFVLAGASFDGVSVNDCIYSGRKAAEHVQNELNSKGL